VELVTAHPASNGWATVGARVRAKRQRQAEDLARLVQARQVADPNRTDHSDRRFQRL
jgi:hypothetical protein